jgi:glycosyltransferase involved in cell wall biosynthesis
MTMATPPLVSIGVPVYNGARIIGPALDALLAQTYANLEVVICDNASTDGTDAICRRYAAMDSRVRYVRNPINIGARGSAGNFGRVLALSTGKYFMWAAADDRRPPTVVEQAVAALESNPTAVLAHGLIRTYLAPENRYVDVPNRMDLCDPDAAIRIRRFTRGLEHNAILYGLYRRDAIVKAFLPKHYADDYLFCLQACLLGQAEYIQSELLTYRQRYCRISPMYPRDPTSAAVLLLYRGVKRNKCWTALVMGVWYLLRVPEIPFAVRLRSAHAHVSSFATRYRRELSIELLFLASTPFHRLLRPLLPAGTRLRSTWRGLRA